MSILRKKRVPTDPNPSKKSSKDLNEPLALTGQEKNARIIQILRDLYSTEIPDKQVVGAQAIKLLDESEAGPHTALLNWTTGQSETHYRHDFEGLVVLLIRALDKDALDIHEEFNLYMRVFERLENVKSTERVSCALEEIISEIKYLPQIDNTELERFAWALLRYERIVQEERRNTSIRKIEDPLAQGECKLVEHTTAILMDDELAEAIAAIVELVTEDTVRFGNSSVVDLLYRAPEGDLVAKAVGVMIVRSQTGEGEEKERAIQWIAEMTETNSKIGTITFGVSRQAQETPPNPKLQN